MKHGAQGVMINTKKAKGQKSHGTVPLKKNGGPPTSFPW
jgi:hypothetical protein